MRAMVLTAIVFALGIGLADAWASQKTVTSDVEARALKEMAAAIPLGSRVKAQTQDGKGVHGTLMSVTDQAVIIKRRTRLPEPAVTVRFEELARLELVRGEGISPGKVIGIGVAAGAGAILTLFAFFAALGD